MHWLLRQFARAYRVSQWQRRRFTPAGRALGYLLIAAAVFGLDTQRTTAFQIFALAAALLLVAWLDEPAAAGQGLAIERRLPEFATAGEPVRYRQIVRNTGTAAAPGSAPARRAGRGFTLCGGVPARSAAGPSQA